MPVSSIHSIGQPADIHPGQSEGTSRRQGAMADAAHTGQREAPMSGADADRASSLEERRQKAFQTIEHTLAMGYEKLAAKHSGSAREFDRFEPLSAEKVASNILGFIERRLMKDAAEDATEAQLQERLEQGLAGFKKGFAEAQKQLEALASFTPEIQADIDDTRERVLSGIEDLRQRILDQQFGPGAAGKRADEADELGGPSAPRTYAYEQARASQFSFELMTAEGDRVSIQASSSAGVSLSGSGAGSSLSASASRSMSWTVEGDLNADERTAIESLLGGVDRLAEQFFTGDLNGALNSAMALGYDREQVVGFSLSLSQSTIQRVSETYGASNRSDEVPGKSLGLQQRLAPLGQFLRDLETALADAGRISAQPESLVLDLSERMASVGEETVAKEAESLREFMAGMLGTLTTDPTAASAGRRDDLGAMPGEA